MTEGDLPDGVDGGLPAVPAAVPVAARSVFLSYASADLSVATQVCTALEAQGVSCWIAPRDVMAGDLYADAIVRAINACQVLVLILSEASVASPHVLREVERASAKRRAVVSVRIDAAALTPSLEYFLSASHWLDASHGVDPVLPMLAEAVRRILAPGWSRDGGGVVGITTEPMPARGDLSRLLGERDADRHKPTGGTRFNPITVAVIVVANLAVGYLFLDRFWLSRHAPPAAAASAPAAAAVSGTTAGLANAIASDKAIAVMPFSDLSERKDQEYFADGLSEELIDLLSKLPELRVAARTSSFYFKSRQATISEIARALGVAHVLEGSIRKSGKMLRVTAQLVRADNGFHVWSETYDRKLDDIFKVQDDIAGAVVKALKVSLLDKTQARTTPAANAEAYNQYLQGRFFGQLHTKEGVEKSIGFFKRALELDPAYEPAWSGLAFSYSEAGGSGLLPAAEALQRSRAAAAEALKIDSKSPRAHVALGLIHMNDEWDWQAADREFSQAMLEDSGNATVLVASGYLDLALGRTGQAAALFQQAVARDPLHASSLSNLGVTYYVDGRYPEAEAAFRKSLEIKPGAGYTHNGLALVLLARGQPEAALAEMQQETDESWRLQGLAVVQSAMGRKAESDAALAQLQQKFPDDAPYQIATVYAYRGDLDEAFKWLDRAHAVRDSTLSSIKADPLLKRLISDPRYKALLARLRLPP